MTYGQIAIVSLVAFLAVASIFALILGFGKFLVAIQYLEGLPPLDWSHYLWTVVFLLVGCFGSYLTLLIIQQLGWLS